MALAEVGASFAQECVGKLVARVGIAITIGFPLTTLSGRFSHWSTLKTVYSRIIGIRRVEALSSMPWSRTCSCFTKYTFVPCSPLRTLPPKSRACLNVRKRGVR